MTQPCAIAQDTPQIALHDIAILTQSDHGKTTLVDGVPKQEEVLQLQQQATESVLVLPQ